MYKSRIFPIKIGQFQERNNEEFNVLMLFITDIDIVNWKYYPGFFDSFN